MTKATKRMSRARKARKRVSTVRQAIAAYGGEEAMAESVLHHAMGDPAVGAMGQDTVYGTRGPVPRPAAPWL